MVEEVEAEAPSVVERAVVEGRVVLVEGRAVEGAVPEEAVPEGRVTVAEGAIVEGVAGGVIVEGVAVEGRVAIVEGVVREVVAEGIVVVEGAVMREAVVEGGVGVESGLDKAGVVVSLEEIAVSVELLAVLVMGRKEVVVLEEEGREVAAAVFEKKNEVGLITEGLVFVEEDAAVLGRERAEAQVES